MTTKRPISEIIGVVRGTDILTVDGAKTLFAPIGAAALDNVKQSELDAALGTINSALGNKAALNHGHLISEVVGLQTALDKLQTKGDFATISALASLTAALDAKADRQVFTQGANGLVPLPGIPTGRFLRDDGQWVELPAPQPVTPPAPAPSNTSIPAISGTSEVGQTLTVSNGTWANSPTSYTYQWRRVGGFIIGAQSATYTLTNNDLSKAVDCVVTATNANGSTAQASSAVFVNAAPTQTDPAQVIAANGMRTAPTLVLASSGVTSVPPPVRPDLAMDTREGDTLVYQWTPDFDYVGGVPNFNGANTRTTYNVLTTNPATPLDVKLAEITAGMGLIAHRAKVQKAPSDASEWSTHIWSGPTTAPAVTGSTAYSFPEGQTFVLTIPTNQPTRVGLGGVGGSSFERITSATSYLTSHQFRLVGNRVPNYSTGDQVFPVTISLTNRAGIDGEAVAASVSIINDPADDPVTSGFDPALQVEQYTYEYGNRTIVKYMDSNEEKGAVGALSHSSGVYWVEYFCDLAVPPYAMVFGFKDTDTGVTALIGGDNTNFDGGAYGSVDRLKKQLLIINFNERRLYWRQDGAPFGRAEYLGGWGGPAGGGWRLPAGLVNARPYLAIATPKGAKAIINTGQFTPFGGVPSGASPWG